MNTEDLFPWDPPRQPVEDTVALLQRDFAYAVMNTAVVVHSSNPAFAFTANTPRGQLMPKGEIKFSDGSTVEVQDIGMCQANIPYMTVPQIIQRILKTAGDAGLELVR